MRNFLLTLCAIAIFIEVSGLIWSGKSDKPSDTFVKLSERPARTINNPLKNGYFLLVGFAAGASADPVQTGYEIWLETDMQQGQHDFNYDKPGRSELRVSIPPQEALPAWDTPEPLSAFQQRDALFRITVDRYSRLVKRYERWLQMPFEDWGFARSASPRFEEIMVAHRLYIAQGFVQSPKEGITRLNDDLTKWRMILAGARTLPLKTMAMVIMDDDTTFFSKLMGPSAVDEEVPAATPAFTEPLTSLEYSLRWPIQNEFILGFSKNERALAEKETYLGEAESDSHRQWVAKAAGLHPDAFQKVTHPVSRTLLWLPMHTQRTWDAYATYYDATIKASETIHSPLPKLSDIAKSSHRTLLEAIANPVEFEPDWESFSHRLMQTDARLRLAGLQWLLRKPSSDHRVPSRLAEAGARYFDPFTGFPMLWSETQNRIYSVGHDGLDDGGDNSFDISAPVVLKKVEALPIIQKPTPAKRSPAVQRKVSASKHSQRHLHPSRSSRT